MFSSHENTTVTVIVIISAFVLGILLSWAYYKNKLKVQELDGSRTLNKKKIAEALERAFSNSDIKEPQKTVNKSKGSNDQSQDTSKSDFGKTDITSMNDMDDLKLINGISSFIETKLHTLGIYTYEQISNFTPEDEDIITRTINYFPGRISKDKWVDQAKKLIK